MNTIREVGHRFFISVQTNYQMLKQGRLMPVKNLDCPYPLFTHH